MKIGDYVRTKRNGIIKIDEIIDNGVITYEDDFGREWEKETNLKIIRYNDKDGWNKGINENDVLKTSSNIIDLIEVGDYVNGSKVLDIAQAPKKAIYTEQENRGALLPIVNNRIESILTKEQFKSMEYNL